MTSFLIKQDERGVTDFNLCTNSVNINETLLKSPQDISTLKNLMAFSNKFSLRPRDKLNIADTEQNVSVCIRE